MQLFIYFIIFITGCFFGSFFTLAVYRIPRKEDILIKHSYCPNCQHKLGFFDLFPLFSYVLLGGKCRYCKTKIRPRYFMLEICSGVVFLLIAVALKVQDNYLDVQQMVYVCMCFLYVAVLFIIAGIDKEHLKIENSVLAFGFAVEIFYIIYQCILGNSNIYQYVIYLVMITVLLLMTLVSLKVKMKQSYFIQILFLSLYMIIFGGGIVYSFTVIATLLSIAFYNIAQKKKQELPIGFFMSICNILVWIVFNMINNYR